MRTVRGGLGNERGSIVVMIAVSLFMMMALAALAIDLASLRDSKAEAQRAADAIALAGRQRVPGPALDRRGDASTARGIAANEIARWNKVGNDTLDMRNLVWRRTNVVRLGRRCTDVRTDAWDVTLNIIPDSQKVRVWVRRAGIRTFFAKMLARPFGHVQAMVDRLGHQRRPDRQLPEAVRDARHVVRER